MKNERVDKSMTSSETDEYDRNYFMRLLLVFVIFVLMHLSTK
jgi:hypothetical protein